MICQVCKASLRANSIFCDTCGQKLDKSDVVMTVTLPKSNAKKAPTQQANNQPSAAMLLGGVALLLLGVWVGATFLSSAPAPITRETTSQVPVIMQTTSIPAVKSLKPEPSPAKPAPEVTPSTQPNATGNGQLVDPFNPGKGTDPDSTLNPFKKKPRSQDQLEDPFKTNDNTLKPQFKAP